MSRDVQNSRRESVLSPEDYKDAIHIVFENYREAFGRVPTNDQGVIHSPEDTARIEQFRAKVRQYTHQGNERATIQQLLENDQLKDKIMQEYLDSFVPSPPEENNDRNKKSKKRKADELNSVRQSDTSASSEQIRTRVELVDESITMEDDEVRPVRGPFTQAEASRGARGRQHS